MQPKLVLREEDLTNENIDRFIAKGILPRLDIHPKDDGLDLALKQINPKHRHTLEVAKTQKAHNNWKLIEAIHSTPDYEKAFDAYQDALAKIPVNYELFKLCIRKNQVLSDTSETIYVLNRLDLED